MKVILSPLAHLKMKYYIDKIEYEISGVGLVEKRDGAILYVSDLFLLKQSCSGAETTLDPQALDEFMQEKLNDETFPIENLKLWWHSHVNMGVFWSGTDHATRNNLDTDQGEENWWLSIVGNKKGERKACLDVFQPHRMVMDDLPVEIGEDLDLANSIEAEIKEKVSIRALNIPKTTQFPGAKNNSNIYGYEGYEDDDEVDGLHGYVKSKQGFYFPKKNKKYRKGKNRHV